MNKPRCHYKANGIAKRRFKTSEQALIAANLTYIQSNEIMRPYYCKVCRGYHLGHGKGKRKDVDPIQ